MIPSHHGTTWTRPLAPSFALILLTAAGCAGPERAAETSSASHPAMTTSASSSESSADRTADRIVPTYTFVSVSTAKPGKLDELAALASRPGERLDAAVDGVVARQVAVDRERNTVIVWVTLDRKETLYDYLATEQGKSDHGEGEDMSAIIETFEMYDLTPYSTRL